MEVVDQEFVIICLSNYLFAIHHKMCCQTLGPLYLSKSRTLNLCSITRPNTRLSLDAFMPPKILNHFIALSLSSRILYFFFTFSDSYPRSGDLSLTILVPLGYLEWVLPWD